jgi:phosphatidylserine decarboxylase
MKFAKGSYSWILTAAIITIVFIFLSVVFPLYFRYLSFLSIIFFLLTVLLTIFFRDPARLIGDDIVAPADGYVRDIYEKKDEDIGQCKIISIFMNIHNVHVNRMPIDGKIVDIIHMPGSHLPAFKKESNRNERVIIKIKTSIGIVKIIQIAGTLARRIVPYIKKNDIINKGEKIGLIRLGSRVDFYLPTNKNIKYKVKIGDKLKAGENSVAKIYV